jgi:cyclopropane fatty-acyl-phospholipid synthase-like methyltransferase
MMHAVRNYGVHALRITLSRAQLELAQQRVREAGLDDRCEVRLLDYRDLNEVGAYDKVVSVGMVEHVGESNLPKYFGQIFRLLRPGGLLLNSGIARPGNRLKSLSRPLPMFTFFPTANWRPSAPWLIRPRRLALNCVKQRTCASIIT